MARNKSKKFNGYHQQVKKDKEPIKIPKVYMINGSYIIGEQLALACKKQGMKVEEVK